MTDDDLPSDETIKTICDQHDRLEFFLRNAAMVLQDQQSQSGIEAHTGYVLEILERHGAEFIDRRKRLTSVANFKHSYWKEMQITDAECQFIEDTAHAIDISLLSAVRYLTELDNAGVRLNADDIIAFLRENGAKFTGDTL